MASEHEGGDDGGKGISVAGQDGVPVKEVEVEDSSEAASTEPASEPLIGGSTETSSEPRIGASTETAGKISSEPAVGVEEPTVYDPTPVIRGYETSEATLPVKSEESLADSLLGRASRPPTNVSTSTPVKSTICLDAGATQEPGFAAPIEPGEAVSGVPAPLVDPLQAKVRETWSLMFGSRYEDDDLTKGTASCTQQTPSAASKHQSSLRTKLDRERRLDEQLQGSTRLKLRLPSTQADRLSVPKPSRRRPKPMSWLAADDRPFETAGLVATAVRFCIEKAMRQAIGCLTELHAIAQAEPVPTTTSVALGVFLTQWELTHLLNDLFHDPTSPLSAARTNLRLENSEYATLPLETLLRVSWFLPLDDFATLRLRVAEVSRLRLSDAKVAVLDAALHRHFVLRSVPGVRLQRLLLRVVEALRPSGSNQYQCEGENTGMVGELCHALHLRLPPLEGSLRETTIEEFMQLTPSELRHQFQLSSVLSIQRVLFFRFLIEAIVTLKAKGATATARRLLERRKSQPVSEVTTPRYKRKKKTEKERPAEDDGRIEEDVSYRPEGCSTVGTHGSAVSPRPPKDKPEVPEDDAFSEQNDALTLAMTVLIQAHPWVVKDATTTPFSSEAIAARASFLAAETFQQSLPLLTASPSMQLKLKEFTAIIHGLASRPIESSVLVETVGPPPEYDPTTEIMDSPPGYDPSTTNCTDKTVDPPPEYGSLNEPAASASKPPPPRVQRGHSGSFPPPYVPTSPAYWTFQPEIPPPTTPTPTSIAKANASPGVGDYDVRRSDKLTFQQRAGSSFAKNRLPTVDEPVETIVSSTPMKKNAARHRAIPTSASTASLESPAYTHWASAAAVERGRRNEEENTMDEQVRDALRLQQSFVLDDLVQNLLHRGKTVVGSRQSKPQQHKRVDRPSSAATTTPPGERRRPTASRVVSRVRTIVSSRAVGESVEGLRKARARLARTPPPPYTEEETKKVAVKQPPRDYEPPVDDAHLQWAARVSEFYKAKLKAASGGD